MIRFTLSCFFAVAPLVVAPLSLPATSEAASNIGQWDGSERSWNALHFTTIRSTLTAAGHTVEPDSALTAVNLADDDLYLIGEPSRAFTPAESADLAGGSNRSVEPAASWDR